MKKILLMLALVVGGFVRGQNISLVANSDTGVGFNGYIANLNGKMIGHYTNNLGQVHFAAYNGTSLTLINNPDAGSFLSGIYGNIIIIYNGNAYMPYITASADTVLVKYNGTNLSIVSNPLGFVLNLNPFFVNNSYMVFNNELYLVFNNKTNRNSQLIKYDGIAYKIFSNPDLGTGVRGYFFIYNNSLYLTYINAAQKEQVCKVLSNNTIIKLPNSISNNKWSTIEYSASDVTYKGSYYLRIRDYASFKSHLAKFNGDSVSVVTDPSWADRLNNSPILFKNSLYTGFYSNIGSNLALFDGLNFIQIPNPDFTGTQYSTFIKHNSALFFEYKKTPSQQIYSLASFDSVNYKVYNSPDTEYTPVPLMSYKNYLICRNSKYVGFGLTYNNLLLFKDSVSTILSNPDLGSGFTGTSDTCNNRFYFTYKNIKNKYQLGYLDFGSLPLKLTSFTAKLQQNTISLNWQTTNEINVSHFNIQRSNNGKDFTTIAKVNATADGAYSFSDMLSSLLPSPLGEGLGVRLYYRLEIVDKDGSKAYSEIKQIRLNQLTDKRINIYPNPATAIVTIDCKDAKQILIIDYLGKTIKQFNNITQAQTINTKQLSKGIYIVKAIMNTGEIITEKLVVE